MKRGNDLRRRAVLIGAFAGAISTMYSASVAAPDQELTMPAEQFKRLDQFEANNLRNADATFEKARVAKERRGELLTQAGKEYDLFLKEYGKSVAVPFALYRKARCLHLDDKRFQAIKAYDEILDYFRNDVAYAAPALYMIGKANWENGEKLAAREKWAEMAQDKDYCRHPRAGDAIVQLAAYLVERNEVPKALEYYGRAGVEFRQTNPAAAQQAINMIVAYYTATKPDEAKLRDLYRKFQTFGRPAKAPDDLGKDLEYWKVIQSLVNNHGRFPEDKAAERDKYYKYWAGLMDKMFLSEDDFRINVANWHKVYERKNESWFKRLDEQFNAYQKDNDYDRILKWVSIYSKFKAKVTEYYSKLDFAKMKYPQVRRLMEILYDEVDDSDMAKRVFMMIKIEKLPDVDKGSLARYMGRQKAADVPEIVIYICDKFDDMEWGKMTKLRFHIGKRNSKEGLPLCDEMIKVDKYAKEASWAKADFLFGDRKYEDAIVAYRAVDDQPKNLWKIVDCFVAMRQMENAIQQLREIEGFFVNEAPRAALAIAHMYHSFGRLDLSEAAARNVLTKYPERQESSVAHVFLQDVLKVERTKGAIGSRRQME